MAVEFPETILQGVLGRNGYVHFSGLEVHAMDRKVELTPVGPRGDYVKARMTLMASDCGAVARAIAEAAAKADPDVRQEIAAQLRAALVTIETRAGEDLDDVISDFSAWRP